MYVVGKVWVWQYNLTFQNQNHFFFFPQSFKGCCYLPMFADETFLCWMFLCLVASSFKIASKCERNESLLLCCPRRCLAQSFNSYNNNKSPSADDAPPHDRFCQVYSSEVGSDFRVVMFFHYTRDKQYGRIFSQSGVFSVLSINWKISMDTSRHQRGPGVTVQSVLVMLWSFYLGHWSGIDLLRIMKTPMRKVIQIYYWGKGDAPLGVSCSEIFERREPLPAHLSSPLCQALRVQIVHDMLCGKR